MKLITIILFFIFFGQLQSQTTCPKNMNFKKYVEYIDSIDVGTINLLFIMKIKGQDNITKRYLISSRDFADLININYFLDTSLSSRIKKAILGEDINFNFDTKINKYLIPEDFFNKVKKKSPCAIYKKYFDKEGIQKGNPIYFYDWGNYPAVLSYLIDNFAVITLKDEIGLNVWRLPCGCKILK